MSPNYSLENLDERAARAKAHLRPYIDGLEHAYKDRKEQRKKFGIPALCLVGMGRAGKDTAGLYLSERFALAPPVSSSLGALPLVAHMIGVSQDEAYADRHKNRLFWIAACNAIRGNDLAMLARFCLGACDLAIGIRGDREFATVVEAGVVALTVWIDNNRCEVDPTVEFTREDCDVVIDNHTSLDRFHTRLNRLGRLIYFKV